ncbi:hypothetical protein MRBLMS1_002835 [Massilia sp. LMS1-1-1.1]
MNPRIYKKQAKRAVQLLHSHGDTTKYTPSSDPGVTDEAFPWKRGKWLRRHRPAEYGLWQRIGAIPEVSWQDFDGEWDGHDSRTGWERHYDHARLPADYWEGPEWECGGKPWPRMTTSQRMGMWRYSQIATGWRWRGGRAVREAT